MEERIIHGTVMEIVRPTTIVESPRLSKALGIDVFLATETFQHTGSFKFRAAYSVASGVPHRLLIAASSGNFGQALAYACSLLQKSSIIVMPTTSAKVKVDAVRSYGGQVEFVDVRDTFGSTRRYAPITRPASSRAFEKQEKRLM